VKSLLKIKGSPKAHPEADGLRYCIVVKTTSAVWMIYGAHIGELNTTFLTAISRAEAYGSDTMLPWYRGELSRPLSWWNARALRL
jgi:hypothetical protein